MLEEFMTLELLGTFAGLVLATSIIVQFTKSLLKKEFCTDSLVRPYALVIATMLTFVFAGDTGSVQGVVLTFLNSVVVTLSAIGGYEVVSDPKAKKS